MFRTLTMSCRSLRVIHMCHRVHVETSGSWSLNSGLVLGSMCLYLLSHLVGPECSYLSALLISFQRSSQLRKIANILCLIELIFFLCMWENVYCVHKCAHACLAGACRSHTLVCFLQSLPSVFETGFYWTWSLLFNLEFAGCQAPEICLFSRGGLASVYCHVWLCTWVLWMLAWEAFYITTKFLPSTLSIIFGGES